MPLPLAVPLAVSLAVPLAVKIAEQQGHHPLHECDALAANRPWHHWRSLHLRRHCYQTLLCLPVERPGGADWCLLRSSFNLNSCTVKILSYLISISSNQLLAKCGSSSACTNVEVARSGTCCNNGGEGWCDDGSDEMGNMHAKCCKKGMCSRQIGTGTPTHPNGRAYCTQAPVG